MLKTNRIIFNKLREMRDINFSSQETKNLLASKIVTRNGSDWELTTYCWAKQSEGIFLTERPLESNLYYSQRMVD